MPTIASLGSPLTLASVARTGLLDNFNQTAAPIAGVMPEVTTSIPVAWDVYSCEGGTDGSGHLTLGRMGTGASGSSVYAISLQPIYGKSAVWVPDFRYPSYITDFRYDVGFTAPSSMNTDEGAYFQINAFVYDVTVELVRIVNSTGPNRVYIGNSNTSRALNAVGTYLQVTCGNGTSDVVFLALSADLGLGFNYKLTVESNASTVTVKINDVVYATVTRTVPIIWNADNTVQSVGVGLVQLSTLTSTSQPSQPVCDVVRLSSLNPPFNTFYGPSKFITEKP